MSENDYIDELIVENKTTPFLPDEGLCRCTWTVSPKLTAETGANRSASVMEVTHTTCAIHSGAHALSELRECKLAIEALIEYRPQFAAITFGTTTLGNRLATLRAVIHEMETV